MKKFMNIWPWVVAVSVGLAGCDSAGKSDEADASLPVKNIVTLEKSSGKIKNLDGYQVRAIDTQLGARVLLSSETFGLVITDESGKILAKSSGDDKSVDVRLARETLAVDAGLWVSHIDESENALKMAYFDLQSNTYQPVNWTQEWPRTMVVACLAQSSDEVSSGHTLLTAWLISEEGVAYQEQLVITPSGVKSTTVREVALGEGVVACSVDDQNQKIYWSQEHVGLLSMNSDEEKDEERRILAAVAPAGSLDHAPSSLQVLPESGSILATIPKQGQVILYSPEGQLVSSAHLNMSGSEAENSAEQVTSVALLAVSESEWRWWAMTDEGKFLLSGKSPSLASLLERIVKKDPTYTVLPVAQTDVVDSYGDAADDPEVWVNAQDASRSLIVATDKKQGLWSYNLQGEKMQFLARGNVNNVDVRYNFTLDAEGESRVVDIAMATNRTTENLDVFAIDQVTGELTFLAGDIMDGSLGHPYGGCLYTSQSTGQTYAFVNNKNGLYQQWRFVSEGMRVRGEKIREFSLNGQPEGCVADDETGRLYLGEEDHGVWTLDLEEEGADLTLMDEAANGHLVADVEGISLYTEKAGKGYLVVSSQGDNAYVLYDRQTNEYIGRFRVKTNAELSIDGSSETDGLAVTSANLGGVFDQGLLVVQDGRNRMPASRQNFKLVPWASVMTGLHEHQEKQQTQQ